jgi:hypothetical protein
MRNYWLRIGLGALAIFGVGMVIWKVVKIGGRRVAEVVKGNSPITIPLAFIPFKLDGRELGTLSRLEILRSSPEQVAALNFRVKLADSVADDALATCVLVAGDDMKHLNANRTFSCASATDTAGRALEPIGNIETQRGRTFVLLAKAGALSDFNVHVDVDQQADSITAKYEAQADSLR